MIPGILPRPQSEPGGGAPPHEAATTRDMPRACRTYTSARQCEPRAHRLRLAQHRDGPHRHLLLGATGRTDPQPGQPGGHRQVRIHVQLQRAVGQAMGTGTRTERAARLRSRLWATASGLRCRSNRAASGVRRRDLHRDRLWILLRRRAVRRRRRGYGRRPGYRPGHLYERKRTPKWHRRGAAGLECELLCRGVQCGYVDPRHGQVLARASP